MWRSQACWLRSTETSFAHFYSIHVFSCSSKKVAHKLTRDDKGNNQAFQIISGYGLRLRLWPTNAQDT